MSFKSFGMWVEEKAYHRRLTTMLLSRLGLDKNALKQDNIKLKMLDTDKIKSALESLPGLDDDKIAELQTWLDHAKDATLTDLITQIGDEVITPTDADTLPGEPAQLPQGQPMPKPQQQPVPQPDPTQTQQIPNPMG